MSLIEKLKKARETGVEVGNFRFTIRRPTDQEAIKLESITYIEIAQRFVVNWSGVKEMDIIPGGDGKDVPFDAELWREWCADKPEFWEPLAMAVVDSYQDHIKSLDDSKKKP